MSQRKCQSGGTQYDLHPPGEILRGPVNLTAGLNTLKTNVPIAMGKIYTSDLMLRNKKTLNFWNCT